jgi:hypothetical protein
MPARTRARRRVPSDATRWPRAQAQRDRECAEAALQPQSFPSDATRAERRRTQREAQRAELRAQGDPAQLALDLAKELEEKAAGKYKIFAARLNRWAYEIRLRGQDSPDRHAEAVMEAIKFGARTLSEIVEDSELERDDARKTLDALVATGRLREVRRAGAELEYHPGKNGCADVLP